MKVRALFPLAAAAGFWLAQPAVAQQPATPAPAANPNQTLADNVAYRLRATGVAEGADVGIVARDGTVTLTGTAKDSTQKDRIIREVRGVSGVIIIRDGLRVPTAGIVQAQETTPVPAPVAPLPLGPVAPSPFPPAGGPIVEPAPLGPAGQAMPDMGPPNLPAYSWPTYAPYNNVSRVAYPGAYPYNAFPFIGPYYPFPKVPLGWRKVTLEWEDGAWYLGRNSAPHDYWRVRFW